MWTSQYDIIVETLTGSEFEVSVTDEDTVGYIKSRIQKYEGKFPVRFRTNARAHTQKVPVHSGHFCATNKDRERDRDIERDMVVKNHHLVSSSEFKVFFC